MQAVFEAINGVFGFIGPLSDLLWDFPTNFEWYRNIPILGNISLAIIVLLGSGIFFTIKLGFIQVTHFKRESVFSQKSVPFKRELRRWQRFC